MGIDGHEMHVMHDVDHGAPVFDLEKTEPTMSIGAPLPEVQTNIDGGRPACFKNVLEESLFVLTTTFAVGQNSILAGAILCMSSFIGEDLRMSASEVTWLSAANSLSGGAFLLFFGRAADLFGRRVLLLTSLASFTIFMLISGFSQNAIMMDVFMGLAGLASAAAVPPAIGKLGAVYDKPSKRKNYAFATFSAGNPIGFVLGAFVSGITTQVASWRASFWVIAVIYAAFTTVAFFTCPPDVEQNLGGFNLETFKQFDFLGAALAVAGIGMFTAALSSASEAANGWETSYVIALLVVGAVSIGGFIYWQSVYSRPLMPLSVWKDRNFTLVVSVLCLGFYGFSGNFFWVSLMWQHVHHYSPIQVAVHLLPAGIGGIVVNLVAALIMHRVSNKLMMIVGGVALLISSVLFSANSASISYWALTFPALVFAVIGQDLEFTVTNMYVMSSLPSEQQSIAGGIFNTVCRLAGTIGLGVQTSIYNSAGGGSEGAAALRYRPYQTTFWVSVVGAFLALFLLPFLTIGTQGGKKKQERQD